MFPNKMKKGGGQSSIEADRDDGVSLRWSSTSHAETRQCLTRCLEAGLHNSHVFRH